MARPHLDDSGERMPNLSLRAPIRHHETLRRVPAFLRTQDGEQALDQLLNNRFERPLGLFRNEEAALRFLTDTIMLACIPRQIWLFGSRARGTAGLDSDVDLLVVLPDGSDVSISYRLVRATAVGGIRADILICTESEFRDFESKRDTIIAQVHEHGRRLYADKTLLKKERSRVAVTA